MKAFDSSRELFLSRRRGVVGALASSRHRSGPDGDGGQGDHDARPRGARGHDELVRWAIAEHRECDRQSVVDAFLQGIELNRASLCAAFSAYAVMTHMSAHAHASPRGPSAPCSVCGCASLVDVDLDAINASREGGAIPRREPIVLAAFLQRHNRSPIAVPSDYGVSQFRAVLDLIDASEPSETPSTLYRKLRRLPGLKLSVEQSRRLIETLGYAGILQSALHRGFLYSYTHFSCPRKSRSSEWAYPVDFWRGSDGVNSDALSHWFAAYPAIVEWRSKRSWPPPR